MLERKAVFVHWEFGTILKFSETKVLVVIFLQFLHQWTIQSPWKNQCKNCTVCVTLLLPNRFVFQSTSTLPQPIQEMNRRKWRKTKIITASITIINVTHSNIFLFGVCYLNVGTAASSYLIVSYPRY